VPVQPAAGVLLGDESLLAVASQRRHRETVLEPRRVPCVLAVRACEQTVDEGDELDRLRVEQRLVRAGDRQPVVDAIPGRGLQVLVQAQPVERPAGQRLQRGVHTGLRDEVGVGGVGGVGQLERVTRREHGAVDGGQLLQPAPAGQEPQVERHPDAAGGEGNVAPLHRCLERDGVVDRHGHAVARLQGRQGRVRELDGRAHG
jgi:hypothetical protein